MKIAVEERKVKDYLTKSKLPGSDYVINPYIGCTHACVYCYACFMKRFTGHNEKWGTFIDVKVCDKPISIKRLKNKNVFISSVTDCYNHYEKDYKITRNILTQLTDAECEIGISTKSNLILRDIDVLKKLKNLKVAISLNTLDEEFRMDMDNASTIKERLETLKELNKNGIYTVLFMSPIFPYITDVKSIIKETKNYVNQYWFENLNLRGEYKAKIMNYIELKYPQFLDQYIDIFFGKNKSYWEKLSFDIEKFCEDENINYINYFYHDKLVNEKAKKGKNII